MLSVVQSQRSHDNPPKGASTGDNVKFKDVLLNATPQFGKAANARVGTDSGTMTFTSANTARMKGVTTLPDGTISFEGEVTVLPNKNLSVPVVGGTGRYANASGTLLVGSGTTSAPNTYSLVLLGAASRSCRLSTRRDVASMKPMHETGTMRVKSGLAEMLKGGVIMDVVDAEQAKVAEDAGACAVMALERVPADIRRDGGVARMSDPDMIREIQDAVTIPVMAKCRIGHFAEAQILQALEIDYIDESEVLTPADLEHHVDKWEFTVPFVCGATNLGEALRRIAEGAAMIRTKGEAGTGDIVNAVTHMRAVFGGIRRLGSLRPEELYAEAKELRAPLELVRWVAENGKLPVVTFTAGGIATPADAALCMQLGADGVFVGSGIFKSGDPGKRARAIVEATTHYMDADVLARVSAGLGEAMVGISTATLDPKDLLETRGW